jgi:hypothetical protein
MDVGPKRSMDNRQSSPKTERRRSTSARGSGVLLVAMLAANLGNLAFHGIASHRLGAEGYGALGALLAILFALAVPAGAVQVALTGEVGRRRLQGIASDPSRLELRLAAIGLAVAIGVVIASPFVKRLLHLESSVSVLFLAGFVIPAAVSLGPRAVLLGNEQHLRHAGVVALGACNRVVLGVVCLAISPTVEAAVFATLLSELLLCLMLVTAAGFPPKLQSWALVLRPSEFGAATIARMGLFLPLALGTVVYPRFVAVIGTRRADRLVRDSLIAVVGLGVASSIGLLAVSGVVVPIIFGPGVVIANEVVFGLGMAATAAGILNLIIHVHLARKSRAAFVAWIGVGLVAAAAIIRHSTANDIVAAAFVASVTAALIGVLALRPQATPGMLFPVSDRGRSGGEILLVGPGAATESAYFEILADAPNQPCRQMRMLTAESLETAARRGFGRVAVVDCAVASEPRDVIEVLRASETFQLRLAASTRRHVRRSDRRRPFASAPDRLVESAFRGGIDLACGIAAFDVDTALLVAASLSKNRKYSGVEVIGAAAWFSPSPRCDVPSTATIHRPLSPDERIGLAQLGIRLHLRSVVRELNSARRSWISVPDGAVVFPVSA